MSTTELRSHPFYIIPYTSSHRATILEIWEVSVRATHTFVNPPDILFFKTLLATFDFTTFSTHILLISPLPRKDDNHYQNDSSNEDANFISIGFLAASYNEDHINNKLEMLFLLPNYVRNGLGRKMLAFAIKELRVTCVDVNEQNAGAVKFYEREGFETVGRCELDDTGRPYPILKMRLRGRAQQDDG